MLKYCNYNDTPVPIFFEICYNYHYSIEEIEKSEEQSSAVYKNSQEALYFLWNHSMDSFKERFKFEGKISRFQLTNSNDIMYQSCASSTCKKKVSNIKGLFYCFSCKTNSNTCIYRYYARLELVDSYGSFHVTAFDDTMVHLLGINANDFNNIIQESTEVTQLILDNLLVKPINADIELNISEARDPKFIIRNAKYVEEQVSL